jgi:hypothetical protein
MYINEIKKENILLNEETFLSISKIFFNTGYYGSASGSKEEKNKFKDYFDENNRLNVLLNLFKYLISQTLSPIQKQTLNYISITICQLLKNQKPPLCHCYDVLEYVNNLKSSPSPFSGYDFPSAAKNSWKGMLKADENFRVCARGSGSNRTIPIRERSLTRLFIISIFELLIGFILEICHILSLKRN